MLRLIILMRRTFNSTNMAFLLKTTNKKLDHFTALSGKVRGLNSRCSLSHGMK